MEAKQLKENLLYASQFKDNKYLPVSVKVCYFSYDDDDVLYVKPIDIFPFIRFNIARLQDSSLSDLRSLVDVIGIDHQHTHSREEIISVIESQLIPYSEWEGQMKELICKRERDEAHYRKMKTDRQRQKRQDVLDKFRASINVDSLVAKYDSHLDYFNCPSDVDEEEAKYSPNMLGLIISQKESIRSYREEVDKLNSMLKKIKSIINIEYD